MKKFELNPDDKKNVKYTLENDCLNRKKDIINLAKYLNAIDENYIISLDGKWGSGKTFFVKQLQYILENDCSVFFKGPEKNIIEELREKYIPVYYNAWANDDHDNVVESLIFNILNQFPQFKNKLNLKNQDFRKIKEDIMKNIIEKGSCGFLSKDILDDIKDIDSFAKNVITYEEKKACLDNIFNDLIKENGRLLLIIDELDRCKPDYAVKILETIKHFYNNNKITIIVSTDNKQLSNCVRKFYGYDFDGYGYLNKMYDAVISINLEKRNKYLEIYCNFYDKNDFVSNVSFFLIEYYDLGLRQCNRFVSMYNLCYKYIIQEDFFDKIKSMFCSKYFLVIGIVLKIINIDEFKKYITGRDDEFVEKITNKLMEKKSIYKENLSRQLNIDSNKIIETVLEMYHEIFNKEKSAYIYSINDALTFIGNKIQIEENN